VAIPALTRSILVLFAVLAAVCVGCVAVFVWAALPTHGPRVAPCPSPRTAVIVVDMQEDYTGPHARRGYEGSAGLVARVNGVLAVARRRGWATVFIRNEVAPWNLGARLATGNTGIRGTPGAAVDARLVRPAGSIEITKWRADAFSNGALDAYLAANRVRYLIIVGVDAAACLNATVRGALNRGYDVTVPPDCTATRMSRPLAALLDDLRKAGARLTAPGGGSASGPTTTSRM